MSMEEERRRIVQFHTHDGEPDQEQLEVVFSTRKRLLVEAPAGYGKTKTMVSKIAYLISSGQVPNPKKVLALTFSVNAACKIRRDMAEQLPNLLSASPMSPHQLTSKVVSKNYHGLCRRILGLYGYLLDPNLKRMSSLRAIDDTSPRDLARLRLGMSAEDIDRLIKYGEAVKKAGQEVGQGPSYPIMNREYLRKNYSFYIRKVKESFLPNGYIPFNAILLFTRELFRKHPEVRDFYRSYFPVVVIDEFQDTNILQWTLLQDIIGRSDEICGDTHLVAFGDPLQRIYGFIGAIEGIMCIAQDQYGMYPVKLKTNHRFKGNNYLLQVERVVRKNAEDPRTPEIEDSARIQVLEAPTQDEEAVKVSELVREILDQEPDARVAVLMRLGRTNNNTKKFPDIFNNAAGSCPSYFYALYSDVDDEYVEFHEKCSGELQQILTAKQACTFRGISRDLLDKVKALYAAPSEVCYSLLILLETFLRCISTEFKFLEVEDKVDLVRDILDNRALKQYLGHVRSSTILSTVHGAKGLEWDYVILPDMERFSFPSYMGLCKTCPFGSSCRLDFRRIPPDSDFEREFYQELSVFYVAVTRARRATYFSYSKVGIDRNGFDRTNKPSCFLKLDGLDISLHRTG